MTTLKKTLFLAFLSAFFLAFSWGASASEPASIVGEGRHFVSSESGFIQKLFGARHTFEGGFTTDLTRGELWALDKVFDIEVRPVPLWSTQEESPATETLALENGTSLPIKQSVPFQNINWGVKTLYQDDNLLAPSGGEGVSIAILDTGVDRDHRDITGRVADCVDFTRSSVVTETCEDENGHGTHLAGLVAGDGGEDGNGVWGVAPDATLAIYKVCAGDGFCWADDVAVALRYVADKGVNIVVLGFSGDEESKLVKNAISGVQQSNVLLIAPVGIAREDNIRIDSPASDAGVIAVGAVLQDLLVPEWMPEGTNDQDGVIEENEVEFAAPGVDIESVWPGNEYKILSGTSQSAALVAGLAAKVWDGDAASTRALLQSLALDIGPEGDDVWTGFGLPVVPAEPEPEPVAEPEPAIPAETLPTGTGVPGPAE